MYMKNSHKTCDITTTYNHSCFLWLFNVFHVKILRLIRTDIKVKKLSIIMTLILRHT